jgi:hypothetical protein
LPLLDGDCGVAEVAIPANVYPHCVAGANL